MKHDFWRDGVLKVFNLLAAFIQGREEAAIFVASGYPRVLDKVFYLITHDNCRTDQSFLASAIWVLDCIITIENDDFNDTLLDMNILQLYVTLLANEANVKSNTVELLHQLEHFLDQYKAYPSKIREINARLQDCIDPMTNQDGLEVLESLMMADDHLVQETAERIVSEFWFEHDELYDNFNTMADIQ